MPVSILLLIISMTGCPSLAVKEIEERAKAETDSMPKNYRPVYMISNIPVDRLRQIYPEAPGDTALSADTNGIIEPMPIRLDLRSIIDRRYPEEVEIRAVLYDTNGRYITGLAPPYYNGKGNYKDYWTVISDSCGGEIHLAGDFEVVEVQSRTSEPHSISFVLDHSPSMGHQRAIRLQQAVKKILSAVKRSDFISVIKFSSKIFYEVRQTDNPEEYRSAVNVDGLKGRYGSGTAIFNATAAGIRETVKAPKKNKRIVVLFTDGEDNSSDLSLDSVLHLAKINEVTIYTIAYGYADVVPMKKIAESTGGKFYQIFSSREFPYVFADIYISLNNYYRIKYKPPYCNDYHSVRLTLSLPEADNNEINAWGHYEKLIFEKNAAVGTMTFMNIEFEFGKSDILPGSLPLIEDVARAMKSNPNLKVKVVGHTDDIGSEEFNMKLSLERAKAVMHKLVEMGIDPPRLESGGYGESQPLMPNDNDENRRKNRRTEFIVIAN